MQSLKRRMETPDSALSRYTKMFKRTNKTTSIYNGEWDNVEKCNEMSVLLKTFSTFDPINDFTQHCVSYDEYVTEPSEFDGTMKSYDYRGRIAVSYMKHPNFNEELLKNRKWDHVVNALMTYLLSSSLGSLLWIKHNYPEYGGFIAALHDEKLADERPLFVLDSSEYKWIYTRAPFKILNKHFHSTVDVSDKKMFHILDHLELTFIEELKLFHGKLMDNEVDESLVRHLETHKTLPHDLQHIIGDYTDICGQSTVRYFTGQACCGKTTLVKKLNFLAKSRGSIGGFSGKSDSLASVSCLHFSIDFVLRQYKNVIGVSVFWIKL